MSIKNTIILIAATAVTVLNADPVSAQILKVEGDLIVNPSSEWSQSFAQVEILPNASLSDMEFAGPPYDAKWTQVQAAVWDGLVIKTERNAGGIWAVEVSWDRPGVLIFNMDFKFGRCFGVNWRLPAGGWRAKGHLTYDFSKKALVWVDFSFLNDAQGPATVNLGDCSFAGENLDMVTEHLLSQAQNPDWMRGLLQESILRWATVTFTSAKSSLLEPIRIALTECTSMTWEPLEVRDLANGMWRVPGRLVFDTSEDVPKYNFGTVTRSETDATLNSLLASQFVLPLNAMEKIAGALARNRGFFSRTLGSSMPTFTALFGGRALQEFEWGDLKALPLHPNIMFDVTAYGPVTLGDRKTVSATGLDYSAKTALAIHSHLWTLGDWYPYFDFRSVESGRARLDIYDGEMHIKLSFDALHLRSYLRDEFAQVRRAEEFTEMLRLNRRFNGFFAGRWFHTDLPKWRVGEWNLVGTALKASTKSLRVPLSLVPVK